MRCAIARHWNNSGSWKVCIWLLHTYIYMKMHLHGIILQGIAIVNTPQGIILQGIAELDGIVITANRTKTYVGNVGSSQTIISRGRISNLVSWHCYLCARFLQIAQLELLLRLHQT